MLDENRKKEIRREEEYRRDVRNELEKAGQKKSSAAWSFLNSSFGLWLLSALFISAAGAVYTSLQNSHAENLKNEELVQKLDSEISYRYSQILIQLYNLTEMDSQRQIVLNKQKKPIDVETVLELTYQQPKGDAAFLYPEFANMNIPALIAELRRHVKTENERQELDKTLAAVTGGVFEDLERSNVELVARTILEKLVLPRWKKIYFYFVNCPPSEPFKEKGIC